MGEIELPVCPEGVEKSGGSLLTTAFSVWLPPRSANQG